MPPMTRVASIAALVLIVACGSPGTATPSSSPRVTGPLGDTWSWDGAAWHGATGPGPSARYGAALAYDAARHVFLLFGGQTARGASNETWTWDGTRWAERSPAHKPDARRLTTMAYDPGQKVLVLYGGLVQNGAEGSPASDTWTWDGNDWTEVAATDAMPGQRIGARLVTAGDQVILFGGSLAPNSDFFADAWTWKGSDHWVRIDGGPTPEGRLSAAVAWDEADSSLFVYGGSGWNAADGGGALGRPLASAWSLKDGAWIPDAFSGPPALADTNALWDRNSQHVIVIFGMSGTSCPQPMNTAWSWDGAKWSRLPDLQVPPRWGAAVAQDESGKALVFGGSDEPGC